MIEANNVSYYYQKDSLDEHKAVSGVSFKIEKGEFVVMLGHNGSGKSTLSRMMNALIAPSEGTMLVDGLDVSDEEDIYEVRRKAGMVFQNPDSQIVCATVEEEIAFGPGNLGMPRDEIIGRIDESLKLMNLEKYRTASPGRLSGGQKQKVAIASVLAMKPDYIILDEPTSMLDPIGRNQILGTLRRLNREEGIAIILVTQRMREAFEGDRILVMKKGELVYDGEPGKLFADRKRTAAYSLGMPEIELISEKLRKKGVNMGGFCPSVEEAADRIAAIYGRKLGKSL